MTDAYERSVQEQFNADAARIGRLEAAARNCAEYLEAIVRDDFEDGCDWPDVDGTSWCSKLCDTHGCMKSRSSALRAALAAAKEQQG